MKALHVALLSGVVCLLVAGCSASGTIPNTTPPAVQTLPHARLVSHGQHGTKRIRSADCPLDSGGISPGGSTC